MMRSGILFAAFAVTGCSYLHSGSAVTPESAPEPTARTTRTSSAKAPGAGLHLTTAPSLLQAMHDRYEGKYLKTMSFLQNNTQYTSTGEEKKSQWYEHIEVPGKLRIAFLPATGKSGLVQVDNRVASFDNGIRVDFRPSINPLLLLTSDVYEGHMSSALPHLGNIAYRVGRPLQFDGKAERFVNDKDADRLLTREYRRGFEIPSSFGTTSHEPAR